MKRLFLMIPFVLINICSYATNMDKFQHPFYIGVFGGYGWTTWRELVPQPINQNLIMNISTPTYVNESGNIWGLFAGYEFLPYFALEANYMPYPNAKIVFGPNSLYSIQHNGQTSFTSKADEISLLAKIMMIIPKTDMRVFSSVGASDVHRYDSLADTRRVSPTFEAGFNYTFTPHVMGELAATYIGGYGDTELNPSAGYIPFLYSVHVNLAYRI